MELYVGGYRCNKWVCSGKINNGADSCDSFPIYEEEIKPVLCDVFRETESDVEALVESYGQCSSPDEIRRIFR